MATVIERAAPFHKTRVTGIKQACPAYSGYTAAIATFNGTPVLITAATKQALVDAVKEINPNVVISLALCERTAVIHDNYVLQDGTHPDDEEL